MTRGEALLAWYRHHRRDLPWRATPDPYRVLVSEVMLQQTQVSRVVPAYERFIDRFPTAEALADASLHEVLEAWSGLGYNTRAVRLREATRRIADEGWPDNASGLQDLPGVGPYTAAAVASIAFGEPTAAVDTNVRRVLSRWMGTPLTGAELSDAAREAVTGPAGDWNQAVMDLGALLCHPRNPDCGSCPVSRWCCDPTVYDAPKGQPAFAGSRREARGATIRSLTGGRWRTLERIAADTGLARDRIEAAVESLVTEGIVERRVSTIRLAP